VPRVGFTGVDSFTFKVQAGAGVAASGLAPEAQPALVTLRVRECRKRGGPFFPADKLKALCACASPLLFVEEAVRRQCFAALVGACTTGSPSATTDTTTTTSTSDSLGQNETVPESPVSFVSVGDGRCDPVSGICAPGLPDKVVKDVRPTTSSWQAARESVAAGFDRMCRACEESPSFNQLRPKCWGEFLHAIHSYGIRAAVGGQATCEADVAQRDSFDQVRCGGDASDISMGFTPEPRQKYGRL
jgi:hypothetical protein